ncbi:MAG TPA: hypothetical protein VGF30_13600 [Bacteroidia bacterium]
MATITFTDGFSFSSESNVSQLSEEQLKECINSLNAKRKTILRKIEYRREDIIRSMGELTFDDPDLNELLDNLSQADKEISSFKEMLDAAENPTTAEGQLLQLRRRIDVIKNAALKMQEQN